MSGATLPGLLRDCIRPIELDAPSLEYLTSMVGEEADFIREAPGCMTREQIIHLLVEKCEDTLGAYELAHNQSDARRLCTKFVDAMTKAKYIQLADVDVPHESPANPESSPSVPSNASSSSTSSASYKPPVLSAPVRISDITRADEERASELEFSQADIFKAKAKSRWSADEEKVWFQSLADTPNEPLQEEEDEAAGEGQCQMCKREMPLTRHHLIPKEHHRHKPWVNDYTQLYLLNYVITICRPCHSAIHSMEDNRTLATSFHTLELIMADERMQRWTAYISKRRVNRTVAQTKSANGSKMQYGR